MSRDAAWIRAKLEPEDDNLNEWARDSFILPNSQPKFITQSDSPRDRFATGAQRDTQVGKPRYDLCSPLAHKRWAELMQRGAEHYGEHNWTQGMPSSRYMASLQRHVEAYRLGDRSEDHLAAVMFGAAALMTNEGTTHDDMTGRPWPYVEGGSSD